MKEQHPGLRSAMKTLKNRMRIKRRLKIHPSTALFYTFQHFFFLIEANISLSSRPLQTWWKGFARLVCRTEAPDYDNAFGRWVFSSGHPTHIAQSPSPV